MRTILLLQLFIVSCQTNPKTDSEIIVETYFKSSGLKTNDTTLYTYNGAPYKIVFDSFYTDKRIKNISGYWANNPNSYGPFFKFDSKGKLEKYNFMSGDGKHNLYEIIYNNDKDQYIELGNSFVDYLAPRSISDTENNYTFIFSMFPRNVLTVFYSKDKLHFDTLHLTKNDTIPFIVDGSVILTKAEIEEGILIKVQARNPIIKLKGLDDKKETIDTVKLK